MSGDRLIDGGLLDDLHAFGETLRSTVDEPIRPGDSVPTAPPVDPGPQPVRMEASRTNRAVWLAAAAALLVAAGFALGRAWPGGTGSVDSTGTPDAGADGGGVEAEGVDEEGRSSIEPDPTTTATGTTDEPVGPVGSVGPATPSTITAADGTQLTVVDDAGVFELDPATELADEGDVVARAVLVELLRLEVFGSATRDEVSERLASGGLRVATTVDPVVVEVAEQAIAELRPPGDRPDVVAAVTVDNRTGAIVATASSGPPSSVLIDGLRQPGSVFKPIVLATLFEQGRHPDDRVDGDGPCRFTLPDEQGGGPYLVGGTTQGIRTVRSVTLSSNNCAFARLGQAAGLDRVAAMARDLGLTTVDEEAGHLSLPLGVVEVVGVDVAGAYATFANGGVHRTPWLIDTVVEPDGDVLYRRDPGAGDGRRVISAETAAMLLSVLEDNVLSGTGTRARLGDGHPAAGKTGTTPDLVDAWFAGSTTRYTTVVWVGDPGPTPARLRIPGWSGFGGGLPAAVWGRYNDELHRALDPQAFPDAPDIGREPVLLVAEHETEGG